MSITPDSRPKIKILYLLSGLPMGGAEMMLCKLLSRLDRQQFEPTVVSLMDRGVLGDQIEALDIPIFTVGMPQGSIPTPKVVAKLVEIVNRVKPDLIQGRMYHGNLASSLASLLTGNTIPVAWSIHYSLDCLATDKKMTVALIKFGSYISKLPKKIFFVSQVSKQQHEALGYASTHSAIIPNGFDTEVFAPAEIARTNLRQELRLTDPAFLIATVGRDHPMKDRPNFIEAAALIAQKYPHVYFLMIGENVDHHNHHLVQLISKFGLKDRILMLGARRDMPQIMAGLDIFTSPSAYGEAFPNVVGEAMSCGVPCVVTDVGDSAWIVGNTGRVVPPGNAQLLAAAWQEIIDLDDAQRVELSKSARSRIVENFSLDFIVSQHELFYQEISKSAI